MSEIIRPGDTLMFVGPPISDPAERAALESRIAQLFPGVTFSITWGPAGTNGLHIIAHYRPGRPS